MVLKTALLRVVSDLLLGFGDGKVSILDLLDLTAAFDTSGHLQMTFNFLSQHM